MKLETIITKWKFPVFLCLLFSLGYLYFFENRALVELEITTPQKTWFNIYWADEGEGYRRYKRGRVRITPNKTNYSFYITDLRKVSKLRIDPHKFIGEVVINKMVISQNGYQPIQFVNENDFSHLKAIFHIESSYVGDNGLHHLLLEKRKILSPTPNHSTPFSKSDHV